VHDFLQCDDGRRRRGGGGTSVAEVRPSVAVRPRLRVPLQMRSAPVRGVAIAVGLMAAAVIVPAALRWHVHANGFAPLSAHWRPRVGRGTVPAVLVAVATVRWFPRLADSLAWPRLLVVTFGVGVAWMVSLATVDGWRGIGGVLGDRDEYLPAARRVTNVSATLHEFVDRISAASAHPWPTHVAGHPPGALLFFVMLVAVGLGGGMAAGWTVVLIAATTPMAVLLTLRRLGAEPAARRVAPILAVGPAAVWLAVSADAVFGAVAAWCLCCLGYSATSRSWRMAGWSLVAGWLLGCCVLLSYGLVLVAVLVVAVVAAARNPRPLVGAGLGSMAIVSAFVAAGFSWWQALPVLHDRYYAGIASMRPAVYWLWGDLAALCFCAGPIIGASVAVAARGWRGEVEARPLVLLTLAAVTAIALADVSLMSKAETERIWLPFVPWLLLGVALLPKSWRRAALVSQVVFGVALQSLLLTRW
jgi:methylthioxylose transferase